MKIVITIAIILVLSPWILWVLSELTTKSKSTFSEIKNKAKKSVLEIKEKAINNKDVSEATDEMAKFTKLLLTKPGPLDEAKNKLDNINPFKKEKIPTDATKKPLEEGSRHSELVKLNRVIDSAKKHRLTKDEADFYNDYCKRNNKDYYYIGTSGLLPHAIRKKYASGGDCYSQGSSSKTEAEKLYVKYTEQLIDRIYTKKQDG